MVNKIVQDRRTAVKFRTMNLTEGCNLANLSMYSLLAVVHPLLPVLLSPRHDVRH